MIKSNQKTDTMKKILLFLTPLLILLGGCNSKPSNDTSLLIEKLNDTSQLIGKWYKYIVDNEDGIESTGTICLDFTSEKDLILDFKINIDGEYYSEIIAHGEYKVSGNTIKYNIPDSQVEYSVNKDFFDTTSEYNNALKEIKKEFMENNEPWSEMKVISITDDQLLIQEDGELMQFEKFQ